MNEELSDSILSICNTLGKHSVEYLIVGGVAVALHGYFRQTTNAEGVLADKLDFDFWYNPTYKNYFNLLDALEEFGQDVEEYKNEQTPFPLQSFFKLEFEKYTLDFLPEVNGLTKFITSFKERELININKMEISFLNYRDLIKSKQANARPKDLNDIFNLERLRKKNKK